MNLLEHSRLLVHESGGGHLSPTAVRKLMVSSGFGIDQLMAELIPLAKTLAQPTISGFYVGAVARGLSGALYLGANLEFAGCPIQLTVHAEQATVINAALHGERGISALAISAPPCGYCRQFLQELASSSHLEVLLAEGSATKFTDYLPVAFGPANLGVVGGLMTPPQHAVRLAPSTELDRTSAALDLALLTAQQSYAPYTRSIAAVVLSTHAGENFAGPYLENAALNPSISPAQAATVALMLRGRTLAEIAQATVVSLKNSIVDHAAATRSFLQHLVPNAAVKEFLIEIVHNEVGDTLATTGRRIDKDLSFYFFDFDDNIMFVETPIVIRNKVTKRTKKVSTAEFARIRPNFGQPGDWKDFEIFDGTYSHFRDLPPEKLKPNEKQHFVNDITTAIANDAKAWQRPSWSLFVHACEHQRPMAIITARGHSRETLESGIRVLKDNKLIPREPNYLAIYSVGNEQIAAELVASIKDSVERDAILALGDKTSALKRIAIRQAVDIAVEKYGAEPEHRFGMSDDDPQNVDLIVKAMCDCKNKYPDKRFFVINTHEGEWVKLEVFPVNFPVTAKVEKGEVVG